jgi:hypothetical protein
MWREKEKDNIKGCRKIYFFNWRDKKTIPGIGTCPKARR